MLRRNSRRARAAPPRAGRRGATGRRGAHGRGLRGARRALARARQGPQASGAQGGRRVASGRRGAETPGRRGGATADARYDAASARERVGGRGVGVEDMGRGEDHRTRHRPRQRLPHGSGTEATVVGRRRTDGNGKGSTKVGELWRDVHRDVRARVRGRGRVRELRRRVVTRRRHPRESCEST